jgi:hypothetical protein
VGVGSFGLRMLIRFALVAVVPLMSGQTAAADQEAARAMAHQFKEVYWKCLADEAVRILPRKMPASDFVIYIKGRCPDEKKSFRVALVDYFAIRHPEIGAGEHLASADYAVGAALDDIASTYVDLATRATQ